MDHRIDLKLYFNANYKVSFDQQVVVFAKYLMKQVTPPIGHMTKVKLTSVPYFSRTAGE